MYRGIQRRHCCIEIDVLVVSGITRVHKIGIASLWAKARRIGEGRRAPCLIGVDAIMRRATGDATRQRDPVTRRGDVRGEEATAREEGAACDKERGASR